MRVTKDRSPKWYTVDGSRFLLEPASKDDLSAAYREAVYEMQNGDSSNIDPHLAENILLKNKVRGWEDVLDENDAAIPFPSAKETLSKEISAWDQRSRDEIYSIIVNPAKNRAKLVAVEKNG